MDFTSGKPNSGSQGDAPDGNTSSSAGHKPQFESGQGKLKKWCGQDYKKIKRESKSRGMLFEDPEFPASNHLLVDDNNQVGFFYRLIEFEKYDLKANFAIKAKPKL